MDIRTKSLMCCNCDVWLSSNGKIMKLFASLSGKIIEEEMLKTS
jgi:hypothetical protein